MAGDARGAAASAVPASPVPTAERRAAVRAELASGGVDGLRTLADRLEARGVAAEPDALRGDLRALGAIRVAGADGPVLAVPVERTGRGGQPGSGQGAPPALTAVIAADADWPLQLAVLVVVAVFLLVAVVGWLISV